MPVTEGFGDGFLGGEAGGVVGRGEFHRVAVGTLPGREDAVEEGIAEAFDGLTDARVFDHIDSDAVDAHAEGVGGKRRGIGGEDFDHRGDRGAQAGEDRFGDEVVADVQFVKMRDLEETGEVRGGDSRGRR